MSGVDRLRTPDVLFHIGGPILPMPLCADRQWIVIVRPECIEQYAPDGNGLCPECFQRYREQRITVRTVAGDSQ
ncbi:MAG TPA: hypothetical protein VFL57_03695 [Bryobacteraceae bacterium]|nr:hypothetical protein [Bryobacteraceae bacterium]